MKDFRLRLIIALIGIVVFFVLMGIAGNIDYTEHVILQMSCDEYDSVKKRLAADNDGEEPTDSEIARWWEKHHE